MKLFEHPCDGFICDFAYIYHYFLVNSLNNMDPESADIQ